MPVSDIVGPPLVYPCIWPAVSLNLAIVLSTDVINATPAIVLSDLIDVVATPAAAVGPIVMVGVAKSVSLGIGVTWIVS